MYTGDMSIFEYPVVLHLIQAYAVAKYQRLFLLVHLRTCESRASSEHQLLAWASI